MEKVLSTRQRLADHNIYVVRSKGDVASAASDDHNSFQWDTFRNMRTTPSSISSLLGLEVGPADRTERELDEAVIRDLQYHYDSGHQVYRKTARVNRFIDRIK